ncbi:MAG: ribokinase [Rhodothermales bacterium]|nr:ribokinase [Rhodothermales bacterium]
MPGPRIVVIGSVNMDLVVRAERLPGPGETVHGHSFMMAPGGKGGNQAVAASRLGGRVALIGCIGDDLFGQSLAVRLRAEGVDTASLLIAPGTASGVALIGVDAAGENAITVVAGANGTLSPADIEAREALIAAADAVLVQLEIPLETAACALRLARRHGVLSILDPAPAPRAPYPAGLFEADILTPNQAEAEALSGIRIVDASSAQEAARAVLGLGARAATITMGDRGTYVVSDRCFHAAPIPVHAVDTTACGDAFAAGLAIALAQGRTIEEAVTWANAAGALAATRAGAQDAMPSWEEVDRLVATR